MDADDGMQENSTFSKDSKEKDFDPDVCLSNSQVDKSGTDLNDIIINNADINNTQQMDYSTYLNFLQDTNPFKNSDNIKMNGEETRPDEFKPEVETDMEILKKAPSQVKLSVNSVLDVTEAEAGSHEIPGEEETDDMGLQLRRLSMQIDDLVEKSANLSQCKMKDSDVTNNESHTIMVKHEPVDDADVHNIIETMVSQVGTPHSSYLKDADNEKQNGPDLSVVQRSLLAKGKEKMEFWKKEFDERLISKDEEEKNEISKLKSAAQQQLHDWSEEHNLQLDRTRETNRSQNEDAVESDCSPNWDRIAELCDFNNRTVGGKTNPRLKLLSRMKNVIVSLQKKPLPTQTHTKSSDDELL